MSLNDAVIALAYKRHEYWLARDNLDVLKQKFEQDHADLIADVADKEQKMNEADAFVRQLAAQLFADTGEKTLHDGVTVKVTKKYVYDDAAAQQWAHEHAPQVLRLDKREFNKLVKETDVPCVTVEEDPVIHVASDLSLLLEE